MALLFILTCLSVRVDRIFGRLGNIGTVLTTCYKLTYPTSTYNAGLRGEYIDMWRHTKEIALYLDIWNIVFKTVLRADIRGTPLFYLTLFTGFKSTYIYFGFALRFYHHYRTVHPLFYFSPLGTVIYRQTDTFLLVLSIRYSSHGQQYQHERLRLEISLA